MMKMNGLKKWLYGAVIGLTVCLLACDNNPYPYGLERSNTYFSDFNEQPKTLDPAQSYASNEAVFTGQIYEPPLQYHYLKRPYQLIPLTATQLPDVLYLDRQGKPLPQNASDKHIAFTRYIIRIQKNIFFEPHPAFVKNAQSAPYYQNTQDSYLKHIHRIADFPKMATRELHADDYIYEIKRLASPKEDSPIAGFMKNIIVGWEVFQSKLNEARKHNAGAYVDLRTIDFPGVQKINDYQYAITIRGRYPQFLYWLAMPFFAPIPWEVDYFYANPALKAKNITLAWYPVGTGPYRLIENNPNRRMVLERNPNFHGERFPTEGEPRDANTPLSRYFGKRVPFIDRAIFSLEKESIPKWNKFLQGYYDESGIEASSFNQTVSLTSHGNLVLTPGMRERQIQLRSIVTPSIYYYGFNMLDPVVGGNSVRAKKLRQAISIAIDTEEYINIFLNGRAVASASPIPPGIFGFSDPQYDFNPIVYKKIIKNKTISKTIRRSIDDAKKLLAEAGYANGIDRRTGKSLLLNYDVVASGPEDQNQLAWMRKQFFKIGLDLNIRATQYNRFQEKIRNGSAQIFFGGWHADYPDPENFLFLFYGKNSKVRYGGENYQNYQNINFDRLFEAMKHMPNTPERNNIIQQMIHILREDSPIVFGFYVKSYVLSQQWMGPFKSNGIANNTLKYKMLDPALRVMKQKEWNHPYFVPIIWLSVLLALLIAPVILQFWWSQYRRPSFPKSLSQSSKTSKK